MVNLLSFSIVLWNSKTKANSEKGLRCAGHVWLVRTATSIQMVLVDQEPTLPPQDPRLLRASPLVEDFNDCFVFKLFPSRSD